MVIRLSRRRCGRWTDRADLRFLAALAEAAGVPEASRDGFCIILDKLDKIGWDGDRSELEGFGLAPEAVTAALDKISALQGLTTTSSATPWRTPQQKKRPTSFPAR